MTQEHNTAYRIARRVSFISLMVMLCGVSVFFVPSKYVSFEYSKIAFVSLVSLVALCAWAVAAFQRRAIAIPRQRLSYALLILLGVLCVSAVAGAATSVSLTGYGFEVFTVSTFLFLVVLAYLVASEFQSTRRLFIAHVALLISAGALAIFHISRFIFGAGFLSLGIFRELVSNTIGTWNEAGIFFGLAAVILVVLLECVRPRRLFQVLGYVAFVLSLCMMVLVGLNVMWCVAGAVSLLLAVYFFVYQKRKIAYTALVLFVLALLFVNPVFGAGLTAYTQKLFPTNFIDVRPSWDGTLEIARGAFSDDPLLGAGPNNFILEWELHRPDINTTTFWNSSFSSGVGFVPTTIIETGSLGLLAWLIFFGVLLVSARRVIVARVDNPYVQFAVLSSVAGVLYLWASLVLYSPGLPLLTLAFFFTGLLCAASVVSGVAAQRPITLDTNSRASYVSIVILVVVVVLVASGAFVVYKKMYAYSEFQKLNERIIVSNNLEAAVGDMAHIVALDDADTYYRTLAELNLGVLNSVVSAVKSEADVTDQVRAKVQALIQGALAAAQKAKTKNPESYVNWVTFAHVYEAMVSLGGADSYQLAVANYTEALKRSPRNPSLYLDLARLEIAHKDNARARDYVMKALDLKPNYVDAIFLLSQIDVTQGNISSAIAATEKIAQLNPNEPAIFFRLGLLQYDQKNYDQATRAFAQAVLLAPSYANARYFLGLGLYNIGKAKDAQAQFEELARTNPDNEEVKFILENLKAGRTPFASVKPPLDNKPEKRVKPPVKETR